MNNCKECRFCTDGKCAKFNVIITESMSACNDFASKQSLQESVQKIKLYD